jgi:hypothetical protein
VREDLKEHVFIFCKLIQLEAFAFCASPLDVSQIQTSENRGKIFLCLQLVSLKHVDLVESKNDEGTLLENLELEGDSWAELEDLLDSDFFKQLGEAEENYNDMNIMGKTVIAFVFKKSQIQYF